MPPVDPRLVRKVARKLTAAINARYGQTTDVRIDRLFLWAMRSARNTDATFAAVQMLRDGDALDRDEAAYLLDQLFDYRTEEEESDHGDPNLVRALEEGHEHELILAAMDAQKLVRKEAFLRDHGEDEFAHMVRREPDAFSALCVAGGMALIDSRPSPQEEAEAAESEAVTPPAVPNDVAERIIALSATETLKEWLPAWHALCASLKGRDPAIEVAAIQSVRAIGAISFEQSLVLMDSAVRPLVEAALEGDREFGRIERSMEAYAAEHGIEPKDWDASETSPFDWRLLHHRRERRIHGMTAMILRQFGEHRQANLIVRNPDEYYRIVDDTDIGPTESPT